MITATWRTKRFSVDARKVLSFKSMTLSTGIELKEKKSRGSIYQQKDMESAAELSIDIHISALMGANPKTELESWIALSRDGVAGRFYMGKQDFLGCTMILTKCEAKDIDLRSNGDLKSCNLSLTFTQASNRITSSSGVAGGGKNKKNKMSNSARIKANAKIASKQGKEKVPDKPKSTTVKTNIVSVNKTTILCGKEASKVSVVTGKPNNTINTAPTRLNNVFRQTIAIN